MKIHVFKIVIFLFFLLFSNVIFAQNGAEYYNRQAEILERENEALSRAERERIKQDIDAQSKLLLEKKKEQDNRIENATNELDKAYLLFESGNQIDGFVSIEKWINEQEFNKKFAVEKHYFNVARDLSKLSKKQKEELFENLDAMEKYNKQNKDELSKLQGTIDNLNKRQGINRDEVKSLQKEADNLKKEIDDYDDLLALIQKEKKRNEDLNRENRELQKKQ